MTGPHPNKGPFTTSYDNDWLGRLATVSLPDGETVRNDYDTGGRLKRVVGTNDCTELGLLTTSVDATATTITVTEYQHGDPASSWNPTLPFTIRLDGEQLNVTARTPGIVPGTFDYTVERGVNGTVLRPDGGSRTPRAPPSSVDVAVPCVHSYLDNQRYDVYGTTSQRQTGDGVVDTTYRDVDTRRAQRSLGDVAGRDTAAHEPQVRLRPRRQREAVPQRAAGGRPVALRRADDAELHLRRPLPAA